MTVLQAVGARSATYVRARLEFPLKGKSYVSAQYLKKIGPTGHRFIIPYALHIFFLVVRWSLVFFVVARGWVDKPPQLLSGRAPSPTYSVRSHVFLT